MTIHPEAPLSDNRNGISSLSCSDWKELIKFRLSTMSAATLYIGYFAAEGKWNWYLPFIGISAWLAAGSAAIINECIEHKLDARMNRTKNRPIASGRLKPTDALIIASISGLSGLLVLLLTAGVVPMLIALAIIAIYTLAYTPLKQHTHWSTEVGALSGALPPFIGWYTATKETNTLAISIFLILYFWQLVHFHPICYRYRKDYRSAGMKLLAAIDQEGKRLIRHMYVYLSILTACTFIPFIYGNASIVYLSVAILANLIFFIQLKAFTHIEIRERAAKTMFRYSLVYLIAVLITLILF